jgi:aarF domain-containing kinase
VHRARLADGREVAVKIQYAGLARAANADLSVLSALSAAAARAFPEFRLAWLYDELRAKLGEELGEWVAGLGRREGGGVRC